MVVILLLTSVCISAQTANDKLIQGIKAYNELDWTNSIKLLNEALQLNPSEGSLIQIYKYLAFCYIETDQLPRAKEAFGNLLNVNSTYELDPNVRPAYLDIFKIVKLEMIPFRRTISVESVPSGASVYFDEELHDQRTPVMIKNVDTKTHSLKISIEGYEDWTTEISEESWSEVPVVQGKYILNISAKLVKRKEEITKNTANIYGSIFVQSNPSSAQVWLDSIKQSRYTPMTISEVPPGQHSLKMTLSDYMDWQKIFNVEAGKTAEINAILLPLSKTEPKKPEEVKKGGALKWYVIGGTVVAAGATAVTLLLLKGSKGNDKTSLTISIAVE